MAANLDKSHNIIALDHIALDLPPSCIEFWPLNPDYFVVGTYELDESSTSNEKDGSTVNQENVDLAVDVQGNDKRAVNLEGQLDDEEAIKQESKRPTTSSSGYSDRVPSSAAKDQQPEKAKAQSRNGSLVLFKVRSLKDHDFHKPYEAVPIQSLQYPFGAIYDLHFHPLFKQYFAVSSSTGTISIYTLRIPQLSTDDNPQIAHMGTYQLFATDVLITYFTWCPFTDGTSPVTMAATLSNGDVYMIQSTEDKHGSGILSIDATTSSKSEHKPLHSRFKVSARLTSHETDPPKDFQAWCCAWSPVKYSSRGVVWEFIYSGGDDSKLRLSARGTTIGSKIGSLDQALPIQVFGGHEAGVTAILPLPLGQFFSSTILTGSYDGHIRVISIPDFDLGGPKSEYGILAQLCTDGEVYRLKFHLDYSQRKVRPDHDFSFHILASCMSAGTKMIEVKWNPYSKWTIDVVAWFKTEGNQLCYASAIQPFMPLAEYDDIAEQMSRICVSSNFNTKDISVLEFDPMKPSTTPSPPDMVSALDPLLSDALSKISLKG